MNADDVQEILKQVLEANPPYGAEVSYEPTEPADGFHAPPLHEGVASALESASLHLQGIRQWLLGSVGQFLHGDDSR